MKQFEVEAVPTANYGKISFNYRPTDALGSKVLAACKRQFKYAPVRGTTERTTFAPEWVNFIVAQGFTMKVVKCDVPQAPMVGDIIGNTAGNDFMAML